MIKVSNEIRVYPPMGADDADVDDTLLAFQVESHWNSPDRVVLVVENAGVKMAEFAVYAKDLEVAIANARNSNRHG